MHWPLVVGDMVANKDRVDCRKVFEVVDKVDNKVDDSEADVIIENALAVVDVKLLTRPPL